MSVLVCTFQGRFGNQCMQYLFARAFAEEFGHELRTAPWIGERIFQVEHARPDGRALPRFNEFQLLANRTNAPDCEFRGYAQMNICMLYSKRRVQKWLRMRPEIETACANAVAESLFKDSRVVAHRRAGDYFGYGYPVVSRPSYFYACERYGIDLVQMRILSEEDPIAHGSHLPDDLSFLPDFYRMVTAPTLLRGNSSFSWLAALLGDGLVLSPIVEGLEGGKEHDCAFVAGNWPRFANLDFVTDLHVAP